MRTLAVQRAVIFLSIIVASCFCENGHSQTTSATKEFQAKVQKSARKLRPFGAPDTVNDRYFYGLHDLACSADGRLFLADLQSMSVRVFNLESQAELYSIGKLGGGAGEFRQIARIRILSTDKLAVIDNRLFRCSIFDLGGKLERTLSLSGQQVDDVDIIDDRRLVFSSFLFDSNFKPLRVIDLKNEEWGASFGQIIDPRQGLLAKFDKYQSIFGRDIYSMYSIMTKILVLPGKGKCVYAQRNPYSLMMFDLQTMHGERFEVKVPFDTEDNLRIEVGEDRKHIGGGPPPGVALSPVLLNGKIVVAVFSQDAQQNYLDVYHQDTYHYRRVLLPSLQKGVRPFKLSLYKNQLLILVSGPADINWVERIDVGFP